MCRRGARRRALRNGGQGALGSSCRSWQTRPAQSAGYPYVPQSRASRREAPRAAVAPVAPSLRTVPPMPEPTDGAAEPPGTGAVAAALVEGGGAGALDALQGVAKGARGEQGPGRVPRHEGDAVGVEVGLVARRAGLGARADGGQGGRREGAGAGQASGHGPWVREGRPQLAAVGRLVAQLVFAGLAEPLGEGQAAAERSRWFRGGLGLASAVEGVRRAHRRHGRCSTGPGSRPAQDGLGGAASSFRRRSGVGNSCPRVAHCDRCVSARHRAR